MRRIYAASAQYAHSTSQWHPVMCSTECVAQHDTFLFFRQKFSLKFFPNKRWEKFLLENSLLEIFFVGKAGLNAAKLPRAERPPKFQTSKLKRKNAHAALLPKGEGGKNTLDQRAGAKGGRGSKGRAVAQPTPPAETLLHCLTAASSSIASVPSSRAFVSSSRASPSMFCFCTFRGGISASSGLLPNPSAPASAAPPSSGPCLRFRVDPGAIIIRASQDPLLKTKSL